MPLYEFECIPCRNGIEESLKQIEKKADNKIAAQLVKKFDNIYRIEVIDINEQDLVAEYGKKNDNSPVLDFYLDEGTKTVLFSSENFRFTDLIYDKSDEAKIKCPFCSSRKLEKVFSSFAFTSDLSTDMPKPDYSGMPNSVRNKTMLTGYIEEKDRPKKNR